MFCVGRLPKSCPFCRRRFVRISQHIANVHSDINAAHRRRVSRVEYERSREGGEFSINIDMLTNCCGHEAGYRVAKLLVEGQVSVFRRRRNPLDSQTADNVSLHELLPASDRVPAVSQSYKDISQPAGEQRHGSNAPENQAPARIHVPPFNPLVTPLRAPVTQSSAQPGSSAPALLPVSQTDALPAGEQFHGSNAPENQAPARIHVPPFNPLVTPLRPSATQTSAQPGSSAPALLPVSQTDALPAGVSSQRHTNARSSAVRLCSPRPVRTRGEADRASRHTSPAMSDAGSSYHPPSEVSPAQLTPPSQTRAAAHLRLPAHTTSKCEFQRRYARANMYVAPATRKALTQDGRDGPISDFYRFCRSTTTAEPRVQSQDPVQNDMSVALKIMKFCAPDHQVESFRWSHFTASKITDLVNTLRTDIGISDAYVKNFLTVAVRMNKASISECHDPARFQTVGVRLETIQKANNKIVARGNATKDMAQMYVSHDVCADSFLRYFEAFAAVKTRAKQLIDRAHDHALGRGDVFYVNAFFNFLNFLAANRPGVYTGMPLARFTATETADHIVDKDGKRVYFLVTTSHKTGSQFFATLQFDGETWKMLQDYVKAVRPKPQCDAFRDFLFLSSSGKPIHNATTDLKALLRKIDPELAGAATNTEFRKIVTTLSAEHLSTDQQNIIHGMLSHSTSTANKYYLKRSAARLPGLLGRPLMSELLNKASNTVGRTVTSFLDDSHLLQDSVQFSKTDFDAFMDYCRRVPAAEQAPNAGTSS